LETALLAVRARLGGHARVTLGAVGLMRTALGGQEVHGDVRTMARAASPRSRRSSHRSSTSEGQASVAALGRADPCRSSSQVERAARRAHNLRSKVPNFPAVGPARQEGSVVDPDRGGMPCSHPDLSPASSGETSCGVAASAHHRPSPRCYSSSHSTLENCMDSRRGLDRRDETEAVDRDRQLSGFQGWEVRLDV
jgi:hypothetical protein